MHNLLQLSDPYIKTIPETTHLLAIIGDLEGAEQWTANTFLQISSNSWKRSKTSLNFVYGDSDLILRCPFIRFYAYRREDIGNGRVFMKVIRRSIDRGFYVYVTIDRYYIKEYADYGVKHANHQVLISGYDGDKIMVSDFFMNNKYKTTCIGKHDLYEAYRHFYYGNGNGGFDAVYLLKTVTTPFQFDVGFARMLLEEYINGENSSVHFWPSVNNISHNNSTMSYGVKVYDRIIEHIRFCDGADIELRAFHILKEHKRMLKALYEVLIAKHLLDVFLYGAKIEEIIKQSENIEMLAVKYKVTPTERLKEVLIRQVEALRSEETKWLSDLIDRVKTEPSLENMDAKTVVHSDFKVTEIKKVGAHDKQRIERHESAYIPGTLPISLPGLDMADRGFSVKQWTKPEPDNTLPVVDATGMQITTASTFHKNAVIEMNIGPDTVNIGLYMMEYYGFERVFKIRVIDRPSGRELYSRGISFIKSGCLIRACACGQIAIEFENISNELGVVNLVWRE